METFVAVVLLTFLVVIAIGIIVLRDLLAAVILLGMYSPVSYTHLTLPTICSV